jgi:hypothetical protein
MQIVYGELMDLKNLLYKIVENLISKNNELKVKETVTESTIVLDLTIPKSEIGCVVGKQGRMILAIRTVLHAIGKKNGKKVEVNIIE